MPGALPLPKVRVTADLPLGSIELLRQLACSQGCTLTEALRRAVATTALLERHRAKGAHLLLETPDGQVTELAFRR